MIKLGQVEMTALDAHQLAEIAAEIASGSVAELVEPGFKRRWWHAIRTDAYEAVVIAWPPGTGLGMHDHGGSLAAIHVVNGRLRERYLDDDELLQVRWLIAGETIDLPGAHVHEVINFDEDEVVSVHVYSPPLDDTAFRIENEIKIAWINASVTR